VREAGVYQRTVEETGVGVPKLMTSSPEAVARAVLRALRRDLPEVVVAPAPAAMRMTTALQELFPSFAASILQRSGTTDVIRKTVRARESGNTDAG
jgi:short-subunit dehydrogenase